MAEQQLPPIVAVLEARLDGFREGMERAKASATSTTSSVGGVLTGLGGVAMTAMAGVGAAVVAGGIATLKMGADFQASMTALATGAGESQSNLGMVSKGILDMAGQVGVSAQDLASGMYMVESAGYHGAAGLTVLKTAAMGAKVGNADMATVADALTSALNAYHLPASQATAVTNDLIATVASGKMHMQDLAGALGTVLPAASTAGVSLKEVTAAIATMTMQGTPASDAATYLRQSILQLENPSAKAKKALADVGLSSNQLAEDLGKKGLAATLQEATDAISKKFTPGSAEYIAHLADMVGGTKSMQAALELTGSNMATFKANVASINDQVSKGGNAVQGWAEVQGDFNQKMERAKDGLEAFGIQLGTKLLPVAGVVLDKLTAFAPVALAIAQGIGQQLVPVVTTVAARFVDWWPTIQKVASTFQKELAPDLAVIKAHSKDLIPVLEAVGLVLLGLVGFAVLVVAAGIKMVAQFLEIKDAAMHLYNEGIDLLNGGLVSTAHNIAAALNAGRDFGNWLNDTLGPIVRTIAGDISNLAGALGSVSGSASSIGGALAGVLGHIPGLAGGGLVTKPTLAMVGESGPEMVVPLSAIRGGAAVATAAGGVSAAPHAYGGPARASGRTDELLEQILERLSQETSAHFTVQIGDESVAALARKSSGHAMRPLFT